MEGRAADERRSPGCRRSVGVELARSVRRGRGAAEYTRQMPAEKPLIMFVHGLFSTPLDFGDQVSAMPDSLQGQAPWLRGARPGSTGETFDIGDAAADLGMTIELSGAPKTTLVGVGEGALVSLEVALTRPDLDVDLVILGPALAATSGVGMRRRMTRFIPRGMLARRGVDKAKALDAMDRLTDIDQEGRLPDLRSRSLLVVGERDRLGRMAADAFAARATSADVRVETVPGANTSPHTEAPNEVNALLYGFIGVEPRRR